MPGMSVTGRKIFHKRGSGLSKAGTIGSERKCSAGVNADRPISVRNR
jgi:hypothetical protein